VEHFFFFFQKKQKPDNNNPHFQTIIQSADYQYQYISLS